MVTLTLYGTTIYRGENVDYAMRMARKLKTLTTGEFDTIEEVYPIAVCAN